MEMSFDYYKNLENVDLFLCNPDGSQLFTVPGKNRNLTLRFNDISELTFDIDEQIVLSDGTIISVDAYDYIRTKRLIYATKIGWFQISNVSENDDGTTRSKSVKTDSLQVVFKNRGVLTEERVYCFYNKDDPSDDLYKYSDEAAVPSVVGQLYQQLGIEAATAKPEDDVWWFDTSTIPDSFKYSTPLEADQSAVNGICRTFKEGSTDGYSWMAKTVEDAFGIILHFDFLNKSISVVLPENINNEEPAVVFTFANFMKSLSVTEDDDSIVTVLNCNGSNCDITSVNPTGTNYICNFDYYKDADGKWMSKDLIDKLDEWKNKPDKDLDGSNETYRTKYEGYITYLTERYMKKSQLLTQRKEISLRLKDLKEAATKRMTVPDGVEGGSLCGIVMVENVDVGQKSFYQSSKYYIQDFVVDTGTDEDEDTWKINAYDSAPEFNYEHNSRGVEVYYYYEDANAATPYLRSDKLDGFNESDFKHPYTCKNKDCNVIIRCHKDFARNFSQKETSCPSCGKSGKAEDLFAKGFLNEPGVPWKFGSNANSMTGSANKIITYNFSQNNESNLEYLYFFDDEASDADYDGTFSYCKLQSAARVKKDDHGNIIKDPITNKPQEEHYCSGFKRYIGFNYKRDNGDCQDGLQGWIDIYENIVKSINQELYGLDDVPKEDKVIGDNCIEHDINVAKEELDKISSELNILNFFKNDANLLRELSHYWIEGSYTNDNIAVLETTTSEEEIALSKQLLQAGQTELEKVSQPKFSFTINATDAMKCYEFKDQVKLLELGKRVAVEKEDGTWYEPALLEISYSLDENGEPSLKFANATRLDDWGYTYGDLISSASSTSRQVNSNWHNIMSYTRERDEVSELIKNPLSETLRAETINENNNEFSVGNDGILGRAKANTSTTPETNTSQGEDATTAVQEPIFEDEQMRLTKNVLMFTDDGWKTAKTALGKIRYTDGDETKTAYGLVAETIVGDLILGKELKIANRNNTVKIDEGGINIADTNNNTVFSAKPDGSLELTGTVTAKEGKIGEWNVAGTALYSIQDMPVDEQGSTGAQSDNHNFEVFMNSNMFTRENTIPYNPVFGVRDNDDISFGGWKFFVRSNGELYARKGTIGDFEFENGKGLRADGRNGDNSFVKFDYEGLQYKPHEEDQIIKISWADIIDVIQWWKENNA